MLQFINRLMHVGQRRVELALLECAAHFGLPALRQFLEGADIDIAVVKIRLQLGHVFHQETPVLADGVAYIIRGSTDLEAFGETIVEIAPALATTPALSAGWSYRSFRLSAETSTQPRAFIQAGITAP